MIYISIQINILFCFNTCIIACHSNSKPLHTQDEAVLYDCDEINRLLKLRSVLLHIQAKSKLLRPQKPPQPSQKPPQQSSSEYDGDSDSQGSEYEVDGGSNQSEDE